MSQANVSGTRRPGVITVTIRGVLGATGDALSDHWCLKMLYLQTGNDLEAKPLLSVGCQKVTHIS